MEESINNHNGIIRPHNSLRNIYSQRTILVVATEGSLSVPEDLETFTEGKNGVNVRFAKGLPLPKADKHPPIDALVFAYQVANEESLNTIRRSLPYVDLRYFVGKCFIMAFSDVDFQPSSTKDIEELAASFHIPVHFVPRVMDLSKPQSKPRLKLPSELMSIYCPPTGNDVHSLIIEGALNSGVRLLNGK